MANRYADYVRKDKCQLCGDDWYLEVHHIIPIVCGGTEDKENLVTLCGKCHARLTPRGLLTKYGMKARYLIDPDELLKMIQAEMSQIINAGADLPIKHIQNAQRIKCHVINKRDR